MLVFDVAVEAVTTYEVKVVDLAQAEVHWVRTAKNADPVIYLNEIGKFTFLTEMEGAPTVDDVLGYDSWHGIMLSSVKLCCQRYNNLGYRPFNVEERTRRVDFHEEISRQQPLDENGHKQGMTIAEFVEFLEGIGATRMENIYEVQPSGRE